MDDLDERLNQAHEAEADLAAKRHKAGQPDVVFFTDHALPFIWKDHPDVVRAAPGAEDGSVELWLAYPAFPGPANPPEAARQAPDRPADIEIHGDGLGPPAGFWRIHPGLACDVTEYDRDHASIWWTKLWLKA